MNSIEEDPLSICPDLLSHATRFIIGNFDIIMKHSRTHGIKWSVYNLEDEVWNKETRSFVYEPQPSSRTDEFIRDTRFSLVEALRIVVGLK